MNNLQRKFLTYCDEAIIYGQLPTEIIVASTKMNITKKKSFLSYGDNDLDMRDSIMAQRETVDLWAYAGDIYLGDNKSKLVISFTLNKYKVTEFFIPINLLRGPSYKIEDYLPEAIYNKGVGILNFRFLKTKGILDSIRANNS